MVGRIHLGADSRIWFEVNYQRINKNNKLFNSNLRSRLWRSDCFSIGRALCPNQSPNELTAPVFSWNCPNQHLVAKTINPLMREAPKSPAAILGFCQLNRSFASILAQKSRQRNKSFNWKSQMSNVERWTNEISLQQWCKNLCDYFFDLWKKPTTVLANSSFFPIGVKSCQKPGIISRLMRTMALCHGPDISHAFTAALLWNADIECFWSYWSAMRLWFLMLVKNLQPFFGEKAFFKIY